MARPQRGVPRAAGYRAAAFRRRPGPRAGLAIIGSRTLARGRINGMSFSRFLTLDRYCRSLYSRRISQNNPRGPCPIWSTAVAGACRPNGLGPVRATPSEATGQSCLQPSRFCGSSTRLCGDPHSFFGSPRPCSVTLGREEAQIDLLANPSTSFAGTKASKTGSVLDRRDTTILCGRSSDEQAESAEGFKLCEGIAARNPREPRGPRRNFT